MAAGVTPRITCTAPQAVFLGRLSPREASRLTERLLKYVIFKVVFCGALIIPDIYEIVMWRAWWVPQVWGASSLDSLWIACMHCICHMWMGHAYPLNPIPHPGSPCSASCGCSWGRPRTVSSR